MVTYRNRILALGLVAILPTAGFAQIEEIVVTAQKRDQSLQDVGIAITAFSAQALESYGVEDSIDLARITPSVHISSTNGGHSNQFTIRGVAQNDFTDSVEAPVAVYVDEGYLATQNGQSFSLFDLERVEIAKGPQGTLFGRNATGGLVHFITAKPTEEFSGYADLTVASYDQTKLEAAISGSITDNVSSRLAIMFDDHSAVAKNRFPFDSRGTPIPGAGSDTGDKNALSARLHLLFSPRDNLEILFTAHTSSFEAAGSPNVENIPAIAVVDAQGRQINTLLASPTEIREAIGPNGENADVNGFGPLTRPIPGRDYAGSTDPDPNDEFVNSIDFAVDGLNHVDTGGASVRFDWDLNGLGFTSITDFRNAEKFMVFDVDGSATNNLVFASSSDADSLTQEFRLSGETDRINWVTGLYYLEIDNKTDTGFLIPDGSVSALAGRDIINEISLDTKSTSVFGHADFAMTDTLSLVAGLRLIREEKDFSLAQTFYANSNDQTIDTSIIADGLFGPGTFGGGRFGQEAESTSDSLAAGKLQLEFRPSDETLIYGGYNRGVKAGSFNSPLSFGVAASTVGPISYDEEILNAYEIGIKTTIAETVQINAAAYYYDYTDYQASIFSSNSVFIENRDAEIQGFEVELQSNPIEGLDLMASIGIVDAKVKGVEVAAGVFRDVEPTFVPDLTWSAMIRYELQRDVAGGRLSFQGTSAFQTTPGITCATLTLIDLTATP